MLGTNIGLKYNIYNRVVPVNALKNYNFFQAEAHNIKLPTLFEIDKKAKEIEKSKNANLKEEDIDKVQ